MPTYVEQLEETVEELQNKFAQTVTLTWKQDPRSKNRWLLMTGPNTWIAKIRDTRRGLSRWTGQLACNFQYEYAYASTKEEIIQMIEAKLRS